MKVNQEKCIGCGICVPYCPAFAINIVDNKAHIDEDLCFECGNCARPRVVRCPTNAFEESEGVTETPRKIRRFYSDPTIADAVTKVPGRGTEEVKTNDVTGKVVRGEFGIGIEMGRPCKGVRMHQVEHMTMALAEIDIKFEKGNPIYHLMEDTSKGTFPKEIKDENMISCIIEFTAKEERLEEVMNVIKRVSNELDTVFSLDLIYRFDEEGNIPIIPKLKDMGIVVRKNAKVNLGMGRPLLTE